ncbi:MAG: HupE/UreJ family protein [Bacteroidota bacterium]
MIQFIATSNNKWAYGVKALVLLLLSVFLTQILWSNIAFTDLGQIVKPSSLAFLQVGATNFSTLGYGHLLFVFALFLFGSKQKFVMKQLLAFTAAYMITLWLGVYHVLNVSNYIVQALVPLTLLFIAGENMYARKLKNPRFIAVFFFGLIHGLGMAGNLKEVTFSQGFQAKSLLMVNIGIELAIICFAIPAFLIFSKLLAGKTYSKTFFNIVSAVLVITAMVMTVRQVVLPN